MSFEKDNGIVYEEAVINDKMTNALQEVGKIIDKLKLDNSSDENSDHDFANLLAISKTCVILFSFVDVGGDTNPDSVVFYNFFNAYMDNAAFRQEMRMRLMPKTNPNETIH